MRCKETNSLQMCTLRQIYEQAGYRSLWPTVQVRIKERGWSYYYIDIEAANLEPHERLERNREGGRNKPIISKEICAVSLRNTSFFLLHNPDCCAHKVFIMNDNNKR